jgi:hypothetical protein
MAVLLLTKVNCIIFLPPFYQAAVFMWGTFSLNSKVLHGLVKSMLFLNIYKIHFYRAGDLSVIKCVFNLPGLIIIGRQ